MNPVLRTSIRKNKPMRMIHMRKTRRGGAYRGTSLNGPNTSLNDNDIFAGEQDLFNTGEEKVTIEPLNDNSREKKVKIYGIEQYDDLNPKHYELIEEIEAKYKRDIKDASEQEDISRRRIKANSKALHYRRCLFEDISNLKYKKVADEEQKTRTQLEELVAEINRLKLSINTSLDQVVTRVQRRKLNEPIEKQIDELKQSETTLRIKLEELVKERKKYLIDLAKKTAVEAEIKSSSGKEYVKKALIVRQIAEKIEIEKEKSTTEQSLRVIKAKLSKETAQRAADRAATRVATQSMSMSKEVNLDEVTIEDKLTAAYERVKQFEKGKASIPISSLKRAFSNGGVSELEYVAVERSTSAPVQTSQSSNPLKFLNELLEEIKQHKLLEQESISLTKPVLLRSLSDATPDIPNIDKCLTMTDNTAWPSNEGCKYSPILLTFDMYGTDNIKVDRFGPPTGGFCGINYYNTRYLEDDVESIPDEITPYMNRAIKEFAPFEVCKDDYYIKMMRMFEAQGTRMYNQYIVNPEYKGIIQVFQCKAGRTFWMEQNIKRVLGDKVRGKNDYKIDEFLCGANQCTFAVPKCYEKDLLQMWYPGYEDWEYEQDTKRINTFYGPNVLKAMLKDRPQQKILIKNHWTSGPRPDGETPYEDPSADPKQEYGMDTSKLHLVKYSIEEDPEYYLVFTLQGLLELGILKELPVEEIVIPPFIHPGGEDLLVPINP